MKTPHASGKLLLVVVWLRYVLQAYHEITYVSFGGVSITAMASLAVCFIGGLILRPRLAQIGRFPIILTLMVVLWFLASFPGPPAGASGPAIQYSIAGMLGHALGVVFAPIGFNWQISIALVPGLAAREVAVSALGTVYAMSSSGDVASALSPVIASTWSLATGLSLLAWYVFAPQCLSTLAVVRRETNSWRYPLIMAGYLFAMAYAGAFVTYRVAVALGGG